MSAPLLFPPDRHPQCSLRASSLLAPPDPNSIQVKMLRAILLGAMIAFASANVDATWYGLQNCDNSGSVTTVNSPREYRG
jgi:hypothetical protein